MGGRGRGRAAPATHQTLSPSATIIYLILTSLLAVTRISSFPVGKQAHRLLTSSVRPLMLREQTGKWQGQFKARAACALPTARPVFIHMRSELATQAIPCSQEHAGPGEWVSAFGRGAPRTQFCVREGFPEKVPLGPSQRSADEGKGPRQGAPLEERPEVGTNPSVGKEGTRPGS